MNNRAAIDRRTRIEHAWAAYEGAFPDTLTRNEDRGEPDFNTPVNKCRAIVNIGNSWLFGKGVTLRVEESVGQQAQEKLDAFWLANNKDAILLDMGKTGKVTGHLFVKVIPDGLVYQGETYPRLVVQDTGAVDVTTDGNDKRILLTIDIYWTQENAKGDTEVWREHWERIDKPPAIGQSYTLGGPERWQYTLQRRKSVNTAGGATLFSVVTKGDQWENMTEPLPWQGNKRPIFDCQNQSNTRDFWGIPDLSDDIIKTNIQVNTVRASTSKAVWYYGTPREIGYGFEARAVTFTPGHATVLPNKDARYEILPVAGDLMAAREHASDLEGDIDEMSGVPGTAIGREDNLKGGDIPAAAMRLRLAPLESKTLAAQSLYGVLLAGISAYALELMSVGQDVKVTPEWPEDLIPKDDLGEAQALTLDVAQGVSQETYQRKRGYDPDHERAVKQTEDALSMQKMAAMSQMMGGQAMQEDTQDGTQESGSTVPNALGGKSGGLGGQTGNLPSKSNKAAPPAGGAQAKGVKPVGAKA